jgi:hypothetical protein
VGNGRRDQQDGNKPRARLALEELGKALREVKPRYSTPPTNGLVLERNWRKDGWCLLIVNVISKTAKFILNLPEITMNALIVTLSVAL